MSARRGPLVAALLASALPGLACAQASAPAHPFDGGWIGAIDCPNHEDAVGYAYDFPVTIEGGVLHGGRGVEAQPSSLRIDGRVAADGSVTLHGRGRTGSAVYTVGHVPKSTPYGLRATGRFEGAQGRATRTDTRPCELTFVRR